MTTYWAALPERAILERPFTQFLKIAERAGQLGYQYIPIPKMRTDLARDAIMTKFLELSKDPDDTLIYLDVDHVHPVNILERLTEDNKPVVASLAVRSNPSEPLLCFWQRDEQGNLYIPRTYERGVIQVAITGSGALAVKRWVFQKLIDLGYTESLFRYQYSEGKNSSSEEILFGQVLEYEKIPVYVDTELESPHCVSGELDSTSYQQWCLDNPVNTKPHKVSVVIPQYKRYEKFEKCFKSLVETAPEAEIIIVIDPEDTKTLEILAGYDIVRVITEKKERPIDKWNIGARKATGDIIMAAGNDVVFEKGWYENAVRAFDKLPRGGMVSVNDTHTDPSVSSPHFLLSRGFIEKHNGGVLMPPCYSRQYPDVENRYKAQSLGMYATAIDSIVRHDHPLTGSSEVDEVHVEMKPWDALDDMELFKKRKKLGFPVTW